METAQQYVRKAERQAFCRLCDNVIEKGDTMLSFYSRRNRGQHIHICKCCVDKIRSVKMEGSGYAIDLNPISI